MKCKLINDTMECVEFTLKDAENYENFERKYGGSVCGTKLLPTDRVWKMKGCDNDVEAEVGDYIVFIGELIFTFKPRDFNNIFCVV